LFLPDFRDEFGLSIQTAGFIASGLQAGYLISLSLVGLSDARAGPRPMVVAGMLAWGVGMATVALAPGALWLAVAFLPVRDRQERSG
jgi:MFS family permease